MQITLNNDVLKWVDGTRGKLSRQAFLNNIIKQAMLQYTEIHTLGNYETKIANGDTKSPVQL